MANKPLLLALAALVLGSGGAWATTSINHQFSPSVINQGDNSLYTITITNDSTTPLTAASATIFLDNTTAAPNTAGGRVTITSGTVLSNTCGFSGVTADATDNKIILTGGTIAAGTVGTPSQCTFSLNVTSILVGTYHAVFPANTTPSASVTGYESTENTVQVRNGTAADITLQVNGLSAPTGVKSYSPSPAIAGDPTTLTVTLTNPNGSATMPLTSFVDALPSGMQVASAPAGSVNCSGTGAVNGSFAPTTGATTLTLTGGTIGQGGTCVLAVKVIVPTVTGTSQVLNNSLGAGAIGNTRGLSSPAFNTDLTVNSPIGVSKSFNPTTVPAGQPSLMTLTLSNNSTTTLLPVTSFLDEFSASTLTILDVAHGATTEPSVTCSGTGGVPGTLTDSADVALTNGSTSIKWVGGTVAKSSTCVITAYVTSTLDGGHTNTVAANAVVNQVENHSSPSANASLTINGQLTVDKTVTLSSVAPGQWTQFTVTIRNWSGGQIDNVLFSDVLPLVAATLPAVGGQMVLQGANPVSNVGCIGGTWTGVDGEATLAWSGGSIAAGSGATPGICTIVFKARLPSSATTGVMFANQIPINGASGICNGAGCSVGNGNTVGNPAASPAVNVTTVDSVAMAKSFSPASIAQGGLSTMTLTLRNRTLSPLSAINLTDNFPAGLTLATNPAAVNNCGGALTAFPDDNKLILTGGSFLARPDASTDRTCTITVKVTSTTLGGAPDNRNTIATSDLSTSAGTIPASVSATLTVATGLTGTKNLSVNNVYT